MIKAGELQQKAREAKVRDPTQQMETTAGTLFGAYNAVTGYYQNVRNFKDGDAKFKSIMDGKAKQRRRWLLTFAETLPLRVLMP